MFAPPATDRAHLTRQPGWARYLLRLGTACAAMAVALLVALHWVPDFTVIGKWARIAWLAVLVGGGGAVYLLALLAMGFRPRDLREH